MKLVALTLGLIFGLAPAFAESGVSHLRDVKTVYVVPTGSDSSAIPTELIRDKIISYLVKYGVSVLETGEDADATLSGSWLTQSAQVNGRAFYSIRGSMRLVTKKGLVLWADDVSNDPYAQSASSSFADDVAKKLTRAMNDANRR